MIAAIKITARTSRHPFWFTDDRERRAGIWQHSDADQRGLHGAGGDDVAHGACAAVDEGDQIVVHAASIRL